MPWPSFSPSWCSWLVKLLVNLSSNCSGTVPSRSPVVSNRELGIGLGVLRRGGHEADLCALMVPSGLRELTDWVEGGSESMTEFALDSL